MKNASIHHDAVARQISVKQLRYFTVLAEQRSFRRAADSLAMSQPPLSKQIQALERSLGIALIKRTTRQFALTDAGEIFYNEACMLLSGLQRVCHSIRGVSNESLPTFTIGMADDFIYGPYFKRLLASAKKLQLVVHTTVGLSPSLEMQVAHGVIDAALVNLPLIAAPAGLVVRSLGASKLCLLVPRGHALARRRKLSPAALQDLPLIMCPEIPVNAFTQQCKKLFAVHHISPRIVSRTTSTQIAELLVEQGAGVALVSQHSVRANNPQLRLVAIDSPAAAYPHALAYRADRTDAELTQLLSSLASHTPKKPPL
jgi:DNA-binding transcriptional LysR family regulator